jgi:hypothetical protein
VDGVIAVLALVLTLAGSPQAPRAQSPATSGTTVTGQVIDATSGAPLSDARVQLGGVIVQTDQTGRFALAPVPPGRYVLTVSVVGYVLVRRDIVVGDTTLDLVIPLSEGTGTYREHVQVTGDLFRQAEPGVVAQQVLGSGDIQNLRGLVLDDPVRALQILPGVAATDDFEAGFSVRGADFAHVGLAIDGVASPFLSHTVQGVEESGSLGMVNSDILERVSLMNGSYPQRFGNRTGAQVEMTLREGSRDRAQARLAVSGSSASIVGEGPIGHSRRGSWLFSARQSYLDHLIKQISDNNHFAFGFSDLAGKASWDLTSSQQLQLSAIVGHSGLSASQLHVGLNDPLWATNEAMLGIVSWRYTRHPRLILSQHVSVTGGRYHSRSLGRVVLDDGSSLASAWRGDATAVLSSRWTLESGLAVAHSQDRAVSHRTVDASKPAELREDARLGSTLAGGFADLRWTGPRDLSFGVGARLDHWTGTDETIASPWVRGETPIGRGLRLVAGTGLYQQFPDFNEVAGLRGTASLSAERAWQADAGIARRLGARMRTQLTAYQRYGTRGIRLPDDDWRLVDGVVTPPRFDTAYINAVTSRSAGIEWLLERRSPNGLSGWMTYSYGRAREHDETTDERFAADFDQRHAFSVYAHYRVSDRTAVSLKCRASSNFPVQGYITEIAASASNPIPEDQPALYALSADRNRTRLPEYARLDLRANRTFIFTRSRLTLFVELMNVFDHTNWRTGPGTIRPNGEIRDLLDPLVPFLPSAGFLLEF